MKKRVLSVLLAVIMLVSALPMVLPTFAATENVFTEADYKALYVQDKLILGVDFFSTNEYWGGESYYSENEAEGIAKINSYAYKVYRDNPLQYNASQSDITRIENGALDTSDIYQLLVDRVDSVTGAASTGYTTELVTTLKDTGAGGVFLCLSDLRYMSTIDKTNALLTLSSARHGDGTTPSATEAAAGAVDFNVIKTFTNGEAFALNKLMTLSFTQYRPASTQSYRMFDYSKYAGGVVQPAGAANGKLNFRVAYEAVMDGDTVVAINPLATTKDYGYFAYKPTVVEFEGKKYIVGATHRSLINEGEGGPLWHTEPGSVSIRVDGDVLYEDTAIRYPDNAQAATYLRLWGQGPDMLMNAVRMYAKTLSADEITLNHAADLLKWFKLDIKSYASMSAADRQLVANELKDLTIESDRAAVAAALKAACDSVAYDFLLQDLPAGTTAYTTAYNFVVVAKEFQLSVSTVKLLPEALRTRVYEAVNGFAGVRNEENLQKVIDDKVEDILDTEYSKYKDPNEYDYKDLYVRQEDLYLAIDFFDAKATDDPIYVGVSYDSWNEEYNRYQTLNSELQKWAPGKSGSVRNWQEMGYETLEKAFEAEVKKLYGVSFKSFTDAITSARNNRVETKRENNWSTLTDKYLWKGNAKDFEALDISDKSYPHTNVRTFGDGTLICTLNNSVMAHLQGNNDNSDVTYQVVGKIAGNWQLRGFRMNFTGTTQVSAVQYGGIQVKGTEDKPTFTASNMGEQVLYPSNARPGVTTSYSVDMTVAIDKRAGADSGQYYSYVWDGSKYVVTRVPAGTEGAYGPEVFPGLMDMSLIMNGDVKDTIKNVPYMQNVSDALGNSGANTYYAIRIYTATLTEAEVRQNHFADLAGLYDLDLSHYYRLSEEDRINLHNTLRGIELGTDKDAVVAAYEQAICDNYYYALAAESDDAVAFVDLAEEYFLDITCLLSISSATRERIYTALMSDADVVAGAAWHPLILQGKLVDLRNAIVGEHYAESIVDTLIDLRGYQYNLYGDKPGMRAIFSVSEDQIGLLAGHYPTQNVDITLGMMLLPAANAMDAVTIENGEIILPDAVIESAVAYDNAFTDEVFYMDDTPVYTIEYYPEGDAANDAVAYVGYICIEIEGEEPVIGYVRYSGNISGGNAFSLTDFAVYAKENLGMAHKNVQTLTNAANDEAYVSFIAGRADISEYVIHVTDKNVLAVETLQNLLAEYVGITLEEVNTEKLPTAEHVIYVGACDTVHDGKDLYGIEARGNNLYLFSNDAANADAMLARFAMLLDMAYAEGYYHMAEGASYVYHARGLAAD